MSTASLKSSTQWESAGVSNVRPFHRALLKVDGEPLQLTRASPTLMDDGLEEGKKRCKRNIQGTGDKEHTEHPDLTTREALVTNIKSALAPR